jgi:G3E family GTPase
MGDALLELKGTTPHTSVYTEKYNPARIIVETSGSAFPAPIAIQIRQLSRENARIHLDSIITVVDCVHFRGYEDISYTAKLQAKYTDVILMNKHELVSEREYDECLDHVFTLNEDTPMIKTYERKDVAVDPDLVFGLDTRLFEKLKDKYMIDGYVDEHHTREVDLLQIQSHARETITKNRLDEILGTCSKHEVYRIKGFVKVDGMMSILNFAFGRWEVTALKRDVQEGELGLQLTVMLARGEGRTWEKKLGEAFAEQNVQIKYNPA